MSETQVESDEESHAPTVKGVSQSEYSYYTPSSALTNIMPPSIQQPSAIDPHSFAVAGDESTSEVEIIPQLCRPSEPPTSKSPTVDAILTSASAQQVEAKETQAPPPPVSREDVESKTTRGRCPKMEKRKRAAKAALDYRKTSVKVKPPLKKNRRADGPGTSGDRSGGTARVREVDRKTSVKVEPPLEKNRFADPTILYDGRGRPLRREVASPRRPKSRKRRRKSHSVSPVRAGLRLIDVHGEMAGAVPAAPAALKRSRPHPPPHPPIRLIRPGESGDRTKPYKWEEDDYGNRIMAHYSCSRKLSVDAMLDQLTKSPADVIVVTLELTGIHDSRAHDALVKCGELSYTKGYAEQDTSEAILALIGAKQVVMCTPSIFVMVKKNGSISIDCSFSLSQHMSRVEFRCDHSSSGGAPTTFGVLAVNSEDAELNEQSAALLTDYLQRDNEFGALYAIGMFGGAFEQVKTIASQQAVACTLLANSPWHEGELTYRNLCVPAYILFFGHCADFGRNGNSPKPWGGGRN